MSRDTVKVSILLVGIVLIVIGILLFLAMYIVPREFVSLLAPSIHWVISQLYPGTLRIILVNNPRTWLCLGPG